MNTPFGNDRDRLGEELRADAPQAAEEFVRSLAHELGVSRPAHRSSRLVFASAFAVIVLGALASFGGAGYAASGANQAAAAVKSAIVQKTSAGDEYGDKAAVQPAPVVKGVAVTQTKSATKPVTSSGTLPFTGLSLIGTLALGGALVGVGIALRRRESRE